MTDFAENAADDRALLKRYAETRAEEPFARLVERYSGLVYGTAMRKTGQPEWAADITQNVFAALAMKSETLTKTKVRSVGAWLHSAATFESKRHVRDQLNAKRRHAMIEEKLAAESGNPTDEPAWEEIRPLLDDALEKLSARDRDIVVLHYFDGLKFREIADRLGLRADAAQKRGARALEKLSRLLRVRGGAVPVAVLAAGLGTELARSAPATLVAKVTAASTGAGAAFAAATVMTTKQITTMTVVAALALFAASVGGGYYLGERAQPGVGEHDVETPPEEAPRPLVGAEAAPPQVAAVPDRPVAQTPAQKFIERMQACEEVRAGLNEELNEGQRGGKTFAEMRPVFRRFEENHEVGKRATEGLDFQETLVAVMALPEGRVRANSTRYLFHGWAGVDPEAALAAAKKAGESWVGEVYKGWGGADPEAALLHQAELAEGDSGAGVAALTEIMEGWAERDPKAAVAAYEQLGLDTQKAIGTVFGQVVNIESKRPAFLEAVANVEDERLRGGLVSQVAQRWMRYAPDETMAWFDTIEFENPRLGFRAANLILNEMTRRDEIGKGVAWLWPKLPEEARGEFVKDVVVRQWGQKDRAAAEAWMRENGIPSAEGGAE